MLVLILRRSLLGLLSLMLVLPASLLHVCQCARGETVAVAASSAVAHQRPCCAKRIAAERTARAASPEIRAKCCCDEVRWNQTITQVPPSRALLPSLFPAMPALKFEVADQRPALSAEQQILTADPAPDDPVRIVYGRWQI